MKNCETTREMTAYWSGFMKGLSASGNLDSDIRQGFHDIHERAEKLLEESKENDELTST